MADFSLEDFLLDLWVHMRAELFGNLVPIASNIDKELQQLYVVTGGTVVLQQALIHSQKFPLQRLYIVVALGR